MLTFKGGVLAVLVMGCGFSAAQADTALPLGDDKLSTAPKQGYVFSCQQQFRSARIHGGPWIVGDIWYPERKIHVQGAVQWPQAAFSVTLENNRRRIQGNDLPPHASGIFPIQRSDPAYRYDRNPNPLVAQSFDFSLPLNPQLAAEPSCVGMGVIGIMLNGVALYNALDAAGKDAAAHETQDACNGHPQGAGQYHYHNWSSCVASSLPPAATNTPQLVGYALDGFGIYGLLGEQGRELSNADLDACHGHVATVLWNGAMQSIYHYHMTREYPYSVGCFMGTPQRLPRAPRLQSAPRIPEAGGRAGFERPRALRQFE